MKLPIILSLVLLTVILATPVYAVETTQLPDVASGITVEGDHVQIGHLISLKEGLYVLSPQAHDRDVIGVVTDDAAMVVSADDGSTPYALAKTGSADVLVNMAGGAIGVGDFIVASNTPGVGMKGEQSGMVVGQALAATTSEGLIPVALNIQFYSSDAGAGTASIFNIPINMKNLDSPSKLIKSILAAIVALTSVFLTFRSVGRAMRSGIDASGRNPLAGKIITASIVLNLVIIVISGLFGLGLAYLIFVI